MENLSSVVAVISLVVITSLSLWILWGSPTHLPKTQRLLDNMTVAAFDTAFIFSDHGRHGLAPAEQAEVRSRIDEYHTRVKAIQDPLWREAHMIWVHYSSKNLEVAARRWDIKQCQEHSIKQLSPLNPLAA